MGNQLLAFAELQRIGIRAFCGSGNEAMITIEDYLDAFEVDQLTETVMLYRIHRQQVCLAFPEKQRKLSNDLKIKQLADLKVFPSQEEADLHLCLVNRKYPEHLNHGFLKAAERWLAKLAAANKRFEVYPQELFSDLMMTLMRSVRRWRKQFRESKELQPGGQRS